MKPKAPTDALLDAALFDRRARDQSLAMLRRSARHRRWNRRIRSATFAVIALGAGVLAFRNFRMLEERGPVIAPRGVDGAVEYVESRP
jgi:hypothetical protein